MKNFFQPTINYLIKTHVFLTKNRILYLYSLLIALISTLPSFFYSISFDPYEALSSVFMFLGGYLILGYYFLLPLMLTTKRDRKKITFGVITKTIIKHSWPVLKLGFLVLTLSLVFLILFSVFLKIFMNINVYEHAFADTKINHGFGFYPIKAGFFAIIEFIGGFIFFLPIIYFLEKINLWSSLKRSIYLYFKNFYFLLPFLFLYAIYYFVSILFIPDGNFYATFLLAPVTAYLDVLICIVVFFFYKDHYKIAPNIFASSVKSKEIVTKPTKFAYWRRFALVVLFAELNLFFGYVVLMTYFASNRIFSDISPIIFIVFASILPFLIYVLKLDSRSFKINLLSIKFAILILIGILLTVSMSSSSTQPVIEEKKQKFTGDELLNAINAKREEYGVGRLNKNEWACFAAEIELEENIKLGNGQFTAQESINDAIAKTKDRYRKTASTNSYALPNFLFEYVTYGHSIEATIDEWNNGGSKLLFLDKKYTHGCAVTKDGYGVVITAEEAPQIPEKQLNYDYSS